MTIQQVDPITMNGAETFKMQWPIIGTEILVYNKEQTQRFTVPLDYISGAPELQAFLEAELKIYVRAHINTDKQFVIEEVLGGMDYESRCGW